MEDERPDPDGSRSQVKEHWNQAWSQDDVSHISPTTFPHQRDETHRFFARRLHDLPKTDVLEIGCGGGHMAVYLAKRGARVTAVDLSPEAARIARRNAAYNGVDDRVSVRGMDALELDSLSRTYDFVVGRFVLHHIEPFHEFVDVLDAVTTPSARGLFLENSAQNRLLMLFREYAAGRFGIPKYSDDQEHPLAQHEINALRASFDVRVHYPELVFLRKINTYLIGHRNGFGSLTELIESLDDTLYQVVPSLREYSYLQVVELVK